MMRTSLRPVIKGRAANVIVVKSPDPMFSEAIFVLRSDAISGSGLSRAEILSQARRAAEGCAASVSEKGLSPLPLLAAFLLGAAITFLIMQLI